MRTTVPSRVAGVGIAVAAVALVTCVKLVSGNVLGRETPFLLYFGATLLAAWLGGVWSGYVATVLSALAAVYFFLAPHGAVAIGTPSLWVQLVVAIGEGAMITHLFGRVTEARARAEREVTERTRMEQRQRTLAEASTLLAESPLDDARTLARLAEFVVPRVADACVVAVLDAESGAAQLVAAVTSGPAKAALDAAVAQRPTVDLDAARGVARVLRTGKSELVSDVGSVAELPAAVHDLGVRSYVIVPMIARGRTLGALTLISTSDGRRYDGDDRALAEDLAWRAALAVDNARLYREAQAAVRARDDFLSIASHELRTPLTTLQLNAQAARRRAQKGAAGAVDPDWVVGRFENVEVQVARLTRLINDLLDVSRITSGRLEVRPEEVDLAALAREVCARHEADAGRAGSAVTVDAAAPVVGRWDRERLDQVLTNLVTNAIKYGRGQPIDVTVGVEDGRARVDVRDRGIGISPEQQTAIFERFERADARHSKVEGFGLGLWIVRKILGVMGGEIGVRSAPGEGSTFTVLLPLQPASATAPRPRAEPALN